MWGKMNPRSVPLNPFAPPPSRDSIRDSDDKFGPPPPHPSQAPRQPQLYPVRDPLFPRRNEREDPNPSIPFSSSQSPFSLDRYAASLSRETPATSGGRSEERHTSRHTGGSLGGGQDMLDDHMSRYTTSEQSFRTDVLSFCTSKSGRRSFFLFSTSTSCYIYLSITGKQVALFCILYSWAKRTRG